MCWAWLAVRATVLGLIFSLWATCALAFDPFTLFLLRILRDQAITSTIESGVAASQEPARPDYAVTTPAFKAPQPSTESQQIKDTIDASFIHLGPQKRAELHASLMQILNDPKNSASRAAILAEFNAHALELRNSQRMLSRLSESDMKVVAAEARAAYEKLPPQQREQLLQALQQGVPGMPKTLQDLMLAEFGNVSTTR